MKKKLFLLLLLGLSLIGMSQEGAVSSLSKGNKILIQQLEKDEEERISRIDVYLSMNPSYKVKKAVNKDSHLALYDILDGKPVYLSTDNLNASRATRTNNLQMDGSLGLNLDGSGMTVGVWDGGPIQLTHTEFLSSDEGDSRAQNIDATIVDGDTGFSNHGTHVAGTIAARGVDSEARGMATGISVKSYNWTNDELEIVNAVNSVSNPIILSNHSYGVPVDQGDGETLDSWIMGAYTTDARNIDNILRNNPYYLYVTSAGNSGNTSYSGGLFSGFDKLTTDKNAKNNLVVANANPGVAEQPLFSGNFVLTSLNINSSSSRGPTDDLRIKPDIAGDGTNLRSPIPNNGYAVFTGTSMAAPNVTGSLALLQQYYEQIHGSYMLSATLKALVCHTALDDNANVGPDPIFGWGFLDATASAELISADNEGSAVIDELVLNQGETFSYTFTVLSGEDLRATICWTDIPGIAVVNNSSSLNNQTPRLINDLDIRITKDNQDYFPWRLEYNASTGFSNSKGDNIRDNIEIIDIDNPATGTYTLTVTHKGNLQGNVGGPFDPQSQNFSLIVSGSNISLSTSGNDIADKLSLYPNPTTGVFNVSFSSSLTNIEDVEIDVFDIGGRLIFSDKYIQKGTLFNETLNLSNIGSGVYIVKIAQGSSSVSKKIIIE